MYKAKRKFIKLAEQMREKHYLCSGRLDGIRIVVLARRLYRQQEIPLHPQINLNEDFHFIHITHNYGHGDDYICITKFLS